MIDGYNICESDAFNEGFSTNDEICSLMGGTYDGSICRGTLCSNNDDCVGDFLCTKQYEHSEGICIDSRHLQ